MQKKGFTMIEVVIVVVILGILSVLVLPRFLNFQKRAEFAAARHFEGVLKEARDIYFTRMVLEAPDLWPTYSRTFYSFVAYSEGVSERNTVVINKSIRDLLVDPGAEVSQPDGSLLFNFKGGPESVYYIDSITGAISAEYIGF
jgi:prepilin-type N-terminal cleavage/methylation domain-containing protein